MLSFVYIFRTGLNYWLVTEEIWPEADRQGRFLEFNHVVAVILGELYVIAFVTAIKLTVDWLLERKRNEELAKLQLSTELKFLKTQIQPHFFFNTLNNLYALTLKKSDNAPQLVVKLSDMMQYVLYEVNDSKVALLQEINHINNYIDIERLRFHDKVQASLNITGNIEDVQVPPLLFLPFIENCFKHGLTENSILEIEVDFTIENKYLHFNLTNTFNPNIQNTHKEKSGIGLVNAQRRLNLLYFNNFKLETSSNQNKYHLYIKIPV
jgi:LytS/YehU family sensor histidine kinase